MIGLYRTYKESQSSTIRSCPTIYVDLQLDQKDFSGYCLVIQGLLVVLLLFFFGVVLFFFVALSVVFVCLLISFFF